MVTRAGSGRHSKSSNRENKCANLGEKKHETQYAGQEKSSLFHIFLSGNSAKALKLTPRLLALVFVERTKIRGVEGGWGAFYTRFFLVCLL